MSSINTLFTREGDAFRQATGEEILAAAHQHVAARMRRGATLSSPKAVKEYLMIRFGTRDYETFSVIHLDNRHRVVECQELFRGTIDGASVHPREVVKEALQRNAAACILLHNHPLGCVFFCNPRRFSGAGAIVVAPLSKNKTIGLALFLFKLPHRSSRQGAALLTPAAFLCSPEVAARAYDGGAAAWG